MPVRPLRLALSALALAAPLVAAPVRDEITVELINVDVHVTDVAGRPVPGLERGDFRLLDAGEPAEITHFAWIPAGDPGAAAAGGGEAEVGPAELAPRRIALFFDELQISDRSRAPVLRALDSQLLAKLGERDEVSIVRFDGAEITEVLGWTADRRKIERGLAELGSFSARRLAAGQELRTWIQMLHDDIGDAAFKGGRGCPDAGVILRGYADLVRRNVEGSAAALLRFARRYSHEPAPRLLVHVSDGIPLMAGAEAYQYAIDMCSGEALAQGVPNAFSVLVDDIQADGNTRDRFDPFKARLEMNEYQLAPLWRDVAARVNALGITVYTVQASAPGAQFFPAGDLGIVPERVTVLAEQNPVDTLALIAHETGGLLLRADRGSEDEIARIAADLGGYYSLAFTPGPGRPGSRPIRVEVDRPGLRLRYRQSYRLTSRDERIAGQLVELFDAGRVDNPLGVALSLAPGAAAGRERLRISVPFSRLTLVDGGDGSRSGLFVLYVTLRRGGSVLVPRRQEIPVTLTDAGAPAYTYDLELPRDGAEVGVAVADQYSGEVSFARTSLPGDGRSN